MRGTCRTGSTPAAWTCSSQRIGPTAPHRRGWQGNTSPGRCRRPASLDLRQAARPDQGAASEHARQTRRNRSACNWHMDEWFLSLCAAEEGLAELRYTLLLLAVDLRLPDHKLVREFKKILGTKRQLLGVLNIRSARATGNPDIGLQVLRPFSGGAAMRASPKNRIANSPVSVPPVATFDIARPRICPRSPAPGSDTLPRLPFVPGPLPSSPKKAPRPIDNRNHDAKTSTRDRHLPSAVDNDRHLRWHDADRLLIPGHDRITAEHVGRPARPAGDSNFAGAPKLPPSMHLPHGSDATQSRTKPCRPDQGTPGVGGQGEGRTGLRMNNRAAPWTP